VAETAFQTTYRQEIVAAFERRHSVLRECCITEAQIKGNAAVFLVGGSGGAEAVTRGVNGLIPARADDLTQNTCTLTEWHDLVRKTGFNVFASQGNQIQLMQETTMSVLNRKIDDQIIDQLATATNEAGAAATPASVMLTTRAKVILGVNNAGGGSLHALITPAFAGYLKQAPEFSSRDYVPNQPWNRDTNDEVQERFRWDGVDWIVHTGLPGIGTSAEDCFMWNKKAIGHAADSRGMQTPVDYNSEHDYSFARASMYMGAKLLQNAGVVVMHHDGSGFAAT
jgi:hypothetical protein